MLDLIITGVLVLLGLFIAFALSRRNKALQHIPGHVEWFPFKIPYIYTPKFNAFDMTVELVKGFNEYGNIYRLEYPLLLNLSFVNVRDLDSVKQVCIQKTKNWDRPIMFEHAFGHFKESIVTTVGEKWRHHRTVCNTAFTDANLRLVADTAANSSKMLIDKWLRTRNSPSAAIKPADINTDMSLLTLDIIGKAGFGYDLKVLETNDSNELSFNRSKHRISLHDALHYIVFGLRARALLPQWSYNLPIGPLKRYNIGVEEFNNYISELITARKSNDEVHHDLLSVLLRSSKDDPSEQEFTDEEIQSNLFMFFFAGHETTASSLSWALCLLAKHQDKQQKLRGEVDAVLGAVLEGNDDAERQPNIEDYESRLIYTNCIIKEALRLYGPATVFQKSNKETDTISGYEVPPNTNVTIVSSAIHRDPQHWGNDAESFVPERFDPRDSEHFRQHNPLAFLPFAIGPRNCIGMRFALVEACMALAQLARYFTWTFAPEVKPEHQLDHVVEVSMRPKNAQLVFTRRTSL